MLRRLISFQRGIVGLAAKLQAVKVGSLKINFDARLPAQHVQAAHIQVLDNGIILKV